MGKMLIEKTGSENPFEGISGIQGCGHLSVDDYDNDGRLDMLIKDVLNPMRYFRQSEPGGKFHLEDTNPFTQIQNRTSFRKPLFIDWNNDGRKDLVLIEQPFRCGLYQLTLVFMLSFDHMNSLNVLWQRRCN